ncbi:MFS general substrate transporter [Apiospora arundinis]
MSCESKPGAEALEAHRLSLPWELEKRADEPNLHISAAASLEDQNGIVYMHGLKLWSISAVIAILIFLVFLEIPIVITALVSITSELGASRVPCIPIGSLICPGVIVIFAKFSDIVGRKLILLISVAFFIVFSAACAGSQTAVQLIVFRAFQGIGGGGCYSLCTTMMVEVVPPERYTQYVSYISVNSALALLVGPIIGGAIAAHTSWRWIFLINIPIGCVAFVMALISIPSGFPYQARTSDERLKNQSGNGAKTIMKRVDFPGTVLLLLATLGLTAGFEEADSLFPWKSAYVISLLTVSGLLWIVLLVWERYVTLSDKVREPVLPWRFFVNRQMMGLLLNLLFLGGPSLIGMFTLPQRFQLVYGLSGLEAGVRLIPFSFAIPVATIFASAIAGKLKVPLMYIFIAGSCFQIVGFALLGTLPFTPQVPARLYGYEILAGWGAGMNFSLLSIAIPLVNEDRDRAVGMAAGAQVRYVGSTIALSIATSVFNTYMRPQLESILGDRGGEALLHMGPSLVTLSESTVVQVKTALGEGYNRQIIVLCISAALQIPASFLLWNSKRQLVA